MQADMKFAIDAGCDGAQTKARQIGLAIFRQRADAADLDRDRAEIRKAAKRIRCDGKGMRRAVDF